MEIKVSRINEQRTFNGSKTYTEVDITNQVVMPIIDIERLDATLDTSSITLINTEEGAITPFTRMIIRITNEDETTDNIYRLVERDDVTLYKYGANPKYKHEVQLVEITKWLERFEVDNTTVTNFLAFLYTDDDVRNGLLIELNPTPRQYEDPISGTPVTIVSTPQYRIGTPVYDTYLENSILKTDTRYNCSVQYNYWRTILPPFILYNEYKWINANLVAYTIQTPSGTTVDLRNVSEYQLSETGKYIITQRYETGTIYGADSGLLWTYGESNYIFTYTFPINVIAESDIEKLPTKYTLSQVVDMVLNKVGNETTVIRENLDEQMFSLDPDIRAKFDTIIAPEFTFTQDTLFGVLSKIGEVAHAIPRLLPNPVNEDDYSDWNIITYDFLGGDEEASTGEVVVKGSYYDGNEYTTNYVSNVQNSFQTNDAEYICLTEPYDGGWISPRTEASDYLVTNDEAVIKTSRPIQRIISLECLVYSNGTPTILDLSTAVKEITDYNLLDDYATSNGIGSKQNFLYYTRGSNIIGGLTYLPPTWLKILDGWRKRAIECILIQHEYTNEVQMKDLKFRIKYVPFYNLKIKQYKPYITNQSGNNELFYNQINSQTVDIESLGEAMKGALLRVSNEEPNITEYFDNHNECIKSGQLLDENYYVYQVNKEINNKRVKATVQFSKDFNKWNQYVAIKKNYREWEISERESIETNPVYNNFCIISDKPEFYVILDHEVEGQTVQIFETETKMTQADLNALLPTPITTSPAWMSADSFMVINKVGDRYYKFTYSHEGIANYWEETEIFLENGILQINEVFIDKEETNKYYKQLQNSKGILNRKFFEQFVTRMSNRQAPIGTITEEIPHATAQSVLNAFVYKQLGRSPIIGDYVYNLYEDSTTHAIKWTYTPYGSSGYWTQENTTVTTIMNEEYYTMKKISWAVGKTYAFEWQGGTEYKQVQKSFLMPCASLSVGNSLVFDFGAQDNYSMGTYVKSATETDDTISTTRAQEQYVEYGNRFGRVDNMELQYGYGEAIDGAFDSESNANAYSKQFYKVYPAVVNTNNVLIDYKMNATNVIELGDIKYNVYFNSGKFTVGTETVYYYIEDGDDNYPDEEHPNVLKLVRRADPSDPTSAFDTIPVYPAGYPDSNTYNFNTTTYSNLQAVVTGIDETTGTPILRITQSGTYLTTSTSDGIVIKDGERPWVNYPGDTAVTIGSTTYTITMDKSAQELQLTENNVNYYAYMPTAGMFRINKDSRQSLQFTNQVHFITDNYNIWIGSALAKTMPFVGNTDTGIYKLVGFTQKPSKFEITPEEGTYTALSNQAFSYSNKTYSMQLYGVQVNDNYKGVGILDNKNRLVLYLNKEVKANEYTPNLYIRLRRKM